MSTSSSHNGRPATVGIVDLGYVGLPLAVAFAEVGSFVVALDVDVRKVEAVARESHIEDVPSEVCAPSAIGRRRATRR